MTDRIKNKAQVMSTHLHAFRSGQWADILGVGMASERLCYLVKFEDGKEDLMVAYDPDNPLQFREKPERDLEADARAAFEASGHPEHHDVAFDDGFYKGVDWAEAGR